MSDLRQDYHPTQPREPKLADKIDRSDIRELILRSADFGERIGEKFRDELSDGQAAMLAHYIRARAKAIASGDMERVRSYNASLASYADEVFAPMVKFTLDEMVEEYIDRNYVFGP